ncbi:MAG: S1-like domain-containing RNA-binding protein [Pseudomonadota bacterium]
MLVIGSYNELVVERQVDFGYYLGTGEDEVLIPSKYVLPGMAIGDRIRVFIYTDSEDRPIATTLTPNGVVGDMVPMTVKDVTPIGAFMDWGLEKDLLVPLGEQQYPMTVGRQYVVMILLDEATRRVYASSRIADHLLGNPGWFSPGDAISLLVYDVMDTGFLCVVNGTTPGMLNRSETYEDLAPGDRREGYISRVREDAKLNLTLKKPGYSSVPDSSRKIIDALKQDGGFIPCHDKSSPEVIKARFAMSKKEFKRAIGGLYKKGLIRIEETGIRLK